MAIEFQLSLLHFLVQTIHKESYTGVLFLSFCFTYFSTTFACSSSLVSHERLVKLSVSFKASRCEDINASHDYAITRYLSESRSSNLKKTKNKQTRLLYYMVFVYYYYYKTVPRMQYKHILCKIQRKKLLDIKGVNYSKIARQIILYIKQYNIILYII